MLMGLLAERIKRVNGAASELSFAKRQPTTSCGCKFYFSSQRSASTLLALQQFYIFLLSPSKSYIDIFHMLAQRIFYVAHGERDVVIISDRREEKK
jgi:hypothetical protein